MVITSSYFCCNILIVSATVTSLVATISNEFNLFDIGSKANIIPVIEAIIINKAVDIARVKWLYLQIEIVIQFFLLC